MGKVGCVEVELGSKVTVPFTTPLETSWRPLTVSFSDFPVELVKVTLWVTDFEGAALTMMPDVDAVTPPPALFSLVA